MPTGRRGRPGPITQEIAAIVNRALRQRGISQMELAEHADVSQSQMSKMLRGEKHIDVEQLAAICHALNIRVRDVLGEAEEVAVARARARGEDPMDVYLAERRALTDDDAEQQERHAQ